jgi:hypothetical protein
MRSDKYLRLHAACLAMAKQSTEPNVQARWQAMADAWLKLATELSECQTGRGAARSPATLPNT